MRPSSILCVDDSPGLLTTLQLGLGHYGFEVTTACNGADALMQFKSHSGKFDAILTDNEMPQMNGLEFVRSVLKEGFEGRIIVMSGNLKPEDLRAYQAYSISGFVHKPFDISSLIATISMEDTAEHA